MDSNSSFIGSHDAATSAPPPTPFEPLLEYKQLRLRPLWIGLTLTIVGFLLYAMAAQSSDKQTAAGLAFLLSSPVFIYYFMVVHRLIRVLDTQPGWSAEYTPAAAVWKHFIPFYGIYFLYQWPRDIESYINWRLGRESHAGLWTFFGVFAGFILRYFDSFLGWLVVMASLFFLHVPLKRALSTPPPTNEPAPGYNGTLGLR